jgi:hypothetical protein
MKPETGVAKLFRDVRLSIRKSEIKHSENDTQHKDIKIMTIIMPPLHIMILE